VIAYLDNDLAFQTEGESGMMPTLVDFLRKRQWVRSDSLLAREFPVNGRRVDLAVLTKSQVASAFELKIGGFSRVLEQAVYNRMTFDRSWVVVSGEPRATNVAEAAKYGVGAIVISSGHPRVLVRPGQPIFDRHARLRVLAKFEGLRDPTGEHV
jgi:hypothetical protein